MLQNKYVTEKDLRDTMNLAKARAYHYIHIGWTMFTMQELISAAYEGIAEALIRFDPSKGTVKETKFSSYAYFWVEKYLKEYITNNKTMLNGSAGELWSGQVPYTQSIDAYDDSSKDGIGSDHKDWLGTDVAASAAIEHAETSEIFQDLLAKIFMELEPIERLVMQLSMGIGTINKANLNSMQIARSLRMKRSDVEQVMANAIAKMKELQPKYQEELAELW